MRKNQRRGSQRVKKNAKRTRKQSRKVLRQSKQGISLARKLRTIIPDDTIFSSFRLHGNTKWRPSELVMLALVWAMSGSGFVTDAFTIASSACQSMFNSVPVATYQGMMHALGSWTDRFMEVIFKQLQVSTQAFGGTFYCERHHVLEMLGAQIFPGNSLFCGDAGFVGYHFWQGIINDGYDFMVRVGSNASLLAEYCDYMKQPDGNVLCWPKDVRSKEKPIRLRLVQVKVGTADVWLLTSVLSERKLSKTQMIAFYKMRWGIEIEFRGLKQTLDCAKMCCLNPSRSMVELNWSVAAMAVAELLALREQLRVHSQKRGKSKSNWTPQRRSLAKTMRAIRNAINQPDIRPKFGCDLTTKLEQALTDTYKRQASKKARHQPRPNKKPLKPPIVVVLTPKERSKIEKIDCKIAA